MSENATIIANNTDDGSDVASNYTVRPDSDWVLTSDLLKLDPVLTQVALGIKTLNFTESYLRKDDHRGPHVEKAKKALRIVMNLSEDAWPFDLNWRFDLETHNKVLQYQMLDSDLNNTGTLDAATIRKLDADLTEIFFYDIHEGLLIHDARKAVYVGAYTAVLADAELKKGPHNDADTIIIDNKPETVPPGTAVFLIQLLEDNAWFYVESLGGIQGYLPRSVLWLDSIMPDPTAKLVNTGSGPDNNIAKLILPHIQAQRESVLEADLDDEQWKFYAMATVRYNNPAGRASQKYRRLNLQTGLYEEDEDSSDAGIYLEHPHDWDPYKSVFGTPGQEEILNETVTRKAYLYYKQHVDGWDNIGDVKLNDDKYIWLPGIRHVDGLYEEYRAGSKDSNVTIIDELKKRAAHIFEEFKDELVKTWPVGWGMRMDAGLGATFGIPVGIDADYYFAIWRESETIIRVVRRGILKAGLDVGAGAGWFLGGGHNKAGLYGKDNNYAGVMLAAGVQFQAGRQIMLHQEMEFHLDSNLAIAAFLAAALNAAPTTNGCIRMFLGLLQAAGIDPNDFTTMLKGELASYKNLTGQAGISLGFGDSPTQTPNFKDNFWLNDNRKQNVRKGLAFSWYSILSLFSFQFGINAATQSALGVQIKHENFDYDPITAFRLPQKTSVEVYADSATGFGLTLPIISTIAPFLTQVSGGIGAKIVADFFYAQADFDGNPATNTGFKFNRFALYTKSADVDIYQGPASEIELGINVEVTLNSLQTSATQGFEAAFQNHSMADFFEGLRIRKIMGLGSILTNSLIRSGIRSGGFFSREKSLNIMISHTDPKSYTLFKGVKEALRYGINLVALIDIDYRPPTDMLVDFITKVFGAIVTNMEFNLENLPKVLELFSPRTMPEPLKQDICRIIEKSDVPEVFLHVELGLALGFGVYAAEAAKLRLRMSGGLNAVYHHNITASLETAIQETFGVDLKTFLKGFFITKPERNDHLVVEPHPKSGGP